MKSNQTYNPCDDCPYSYSKTGEESRMCKICELTHFISIRPKEGKWVPKETMIRSIDALNYTCSECGMEGKHTNYCPNCGAKMSKEY
jgi:hypothetical protein